MVDKKDSLLKEQTTIVSYYSYPGLNYSTKLKVIDPDSIAISSRVTTDDIARTVSTVFTINTKEMFGKSRLHDTVCARRAFIAIVSEFFNLTLSAIGKLTNRNHATILHSNRQHQNWIGTYSEYTVLYEQAREMCININLYENEEIDESNL
tara:strand:+ start:70 stop:522 length:453 start_codon:yes stop_codon:yes gene_type:complete